MPPTPTPDESPQQDHPELSRRGFLAAGAGTAGAIAMAGPALAAPVPDGTAAAASHAAAVNAVPAGRFGRMFPNLPPFIAANDRNRMALIDMGKAGGMMDAGDNLAVGPIQLIADPAQSVNNRDNPTHTAGTTFLGQFLDHDLTFDQTSQLGVPTSPEGTVNARTAALDLDSVYGAGPTGSPQLYEADRIKLRIESGGLFEDLPRNANGSAIIADPRNDENIIIAGLQCAIILAHNRAVDDLRAQGVPTNQLFARARQLITWHYQWIVVNEFLPQIIGQSMTTQILTGGRRWYKPEPGPAFIPVEFQGAAYRFGHSMVRPSYRANLAGNSDGSAFFGMIFDPAGENQPDPVDLRGGRRARRRFIGWQTFFDFGGDQTQHVRTNKRIDTRISTPLFRLPLGAIASGDPPISLAQRNLLRHLTWSIPAGQLIAQWIGAPMLHRMELAHYGVALENHTPLWYYVMAEAQAMHDGLHLGTTGGRIVGEVFIGVLQLDPGSYLNAVPRFRPSLPSASPGTFKMTDLLRYARVDPASRGQ